jgi:NAD(P)-dependent dehydrogenase (short-subunit alcohol dehydrogenase family)
MDLQLSGKKALVTGGSRGIGKSIARQLAREGVDCAICARNEGSLRAAADELAQDTGQRILPFVADMLDGEAIKRLVGQAAEALDGIDILVNNAARRGGSVPDDFNRVTDELILKDFTEKFLGYFRCAREVAPYMRANGWGRIINISGGAARSAGGISAGARNAATIHMTKTLSIELGPHGINVNAIYPGAVLTEDRMAQIAARGEADAGPPRADNAIGRMVTTDEIAYVVVFLASPLAAGITGEVISVMAGSGNSVYY